MYNLLFAISIGFNVSVTSTIPLVPVDMINIEKMELTEFQKNRILYKNRNWTESNPNLKHFFIGNGYETLEDCKKDRWKIRSNPYFSEMEKDGHFVSECTKWEN